MANYDSPKGLFPISPYPRETKYTAGAADLAKGDVVGLHPTTKVVALFVAATHGVPLGVMAHDCVAGDPAYVYDDPATEYLAQFDGDFNAVTSLGAYDLKGTTGAMQIDGSNRIRGSVIVVAHHPIPGSMSSGQDARVRCRLAPWTAPEGTNLSKKILRPSAFTESTLSGTATVSLSTGDFIKYDPGGASRDVGFNAECETNGYSCLIANAADAAENLTIKDSAGTTICILNQNEAAVLFYGTAWHYIGLTHVVSLAA